MEITSQEQLEKACLNRTIGLCAITFISLFPGCESSTSAFKAIHGTLKALKRNLHDAMTEDSHSTQRATSLAVMPSLVWINAARFPSLLTPFNMDPTATPSAVVLSPRHWRYWTLSTGYEPSGLERLLFGVSAGTAPMRPFGLPDRTRVVLGEEAEGWDAEPEKEEL